MVLAVEEIEIVAAGRRILGPVSLELGAGSLTTIVGPNGAGKSTLVRAMSGELRPARGRVRLHGRDIAGLAPAQLATRRAVLPQASTIAFPFTVNEVVALALGQRFDLDAAVRQRRVGKALAAVDLSGFGDRLYQRLSGGEQQRVQLARVLCQSGEPVEDAEAKLLILDEPTSSLDIRHQVGVLTIARRFVEAGGVVVAVLHDLNLAAAFSDRMIVLEAGTIAADDAPGPLLASGVLSKVFGIDMTILHPGGWSRPAILPDFSDHGDTPRKSRHLPSEA
ncbi:heme ABC transporter ATP-binding protein [Jiella mangrovi]|uniref:Heme ABC transporter ATP-binding protein n=1 Tax=Jiella mangrovi TaxID=2821407 RepID=A0ABS4BHS9_9HYPH|nr:heme ABC transporter ATP-binding protein [Jiella mangrovi]MBP0616246.1 heme ABC transporter ATP-binding protein [Jiella mangrovi]